MNHLKSLVPALVLSLAAGAATATPGPDLSQLAPWPNTDGNYLQLLQDQAEDWYIAAAVVRGSKVSTSLAKVDRPADPASLLQQHLPLASIHVRGIDCESLEYKHLVVAQQPELESYWMAFPRGITTPKPSCQIMNTPEKWQFVEGE